MKLHYLFALIPTLALAQNESVQIYQQMDDSGEVIFTDKAPPDTKEVPINPSQSYQRPPTRNWTARPVEKSSIATQYKTQIVRPENDAVFLHDDNIVVVEVVSEPLLPPHYQFELLINKESTVPSNANGLFILENLYRGIYSLTAQVKDEQGRVVSHSQSPAIQFTQKRWAAP